MATVAASVAFWNSGNVTVPRLDLPAKGDSVVDDRKLSPQRTLGFCLTPISASLHLLHCWIDVTSSLHSSSPMAVFEARDPFTQACRPTQ